MLPCYIYTKLYWEICLVLLVNCLGYHVCLGFTFVNLLPTRGNTQARTKSTVPFQNTFALLLWSIICCNMEFYFSNFRFLVDLSFAFVAWQSLILPADMRPDLDLLLGAFMISFMGFCEQSIIILYLMLLCVAIARNDALLALLSTWFSPN